VSTYTISGNDCSSTSRRFEAIRGNSNSLPEA
jgi:hypothetical protein